MYTIRQIAELTEVSKPTVAAAIKALKIEPAETGMNRIRLYSLEDTQQIILSIKPTFDFSLLAQNAQNAEKVQNLGANLAQNVERVQNDYIQDLRDTIENLRQQLDQKDKQLEQAQQLADQAQKLQAAAEKRLDAVEQQLTKLISMQPEDKRSFNKSLFGRDKTNTSADQEGSAAEPKKVTQFFKRLFGKKDDIQEQQQPEEHKDS